MADVEEKQLTQILERSKKVVEDVEGKLKEKKIKKIQELKLQIAARSQTEKEIITEIEKLSVKCFDANKDKIEKLENLKELEDNTDIWSANRIHEDEQFHRKNRRDIRNIFREMSASLDYLKEALWSMSFFGNFKWTQSGYCGRGWGESVTEKVVWVEENDKINFIHGLLTCTDKTSHIMIFRETVDEIYELKNALFRKGIRSLCVHKYKSERGEDYENFRDFSTNLLITTPFCVGGIGFPTARTVINFDMPRDIEEYRGRKRFVESLGQFVSFFNWQSSIYVHDLVDHLEDNKQEVTREIKSLADSTRRLKRKYEEYDE